MLAFARSLNWLYLIRMLAQYIAPALVVLALVGELTSVGASGAVNIVLLTVFALLTVVMIGICGWTVFLWDIDRLFFRLESRIDSQLGETPTKNDEPPDDSLLGRVRELVGNAVSNVRIKSIALVERSYWDDINAGGVLSFPQPDIAAAIEHIDKPRRDLLASLTDYVASAIPLGSFSASLMSRVIFRYVAPEVKVRLYRRLIVRF